MTRYMLTKISNARALGAVVLIMLPMIAGSQTVKLWPGVAPGSERWTQKEVTYENTPVGTVTMNVVTPTITAYLPDRASATGVGVIIAPGGGFVALATSQGGTDVAHWLQARGIAAFVLKYRTIEKTFEGIPPMDQDTAGRYGIADGIKAVKVVRQHSAEWDVSPKRIGMIGFSAGGMVVSGALLQRDSAARPSFAALIYGAPFGVMPAIPSGLPPVFMAWAEDDGIARVFMPRFSRALTASSVKPDAHVYKTGGHGFGVAPRGAKSDQWVTDFQRWLREIGMLTAAKR
ncbi:MAG: alpha/beta hydrolase [Gemmatimonadota bacterium]|nr:alpha/beta hydrolase [Gemmatimonadota bacterium]